MWTLEKMETRTAMKAAKSCNGPYSVAVAALMMMMMMMIMTMMTMMNTILTQQKGSFSSTKKTTARPMR